MTQTTKALEGKTRGRIVFNRTELLSVPDAAKRLGISEETVRRHVRSGKLRAEKLGHQWFIHVDDLRAFSEHYDPRTGPPRRR
jgi:excisionase family DNA binding protein